MNPFVAIRGCSHLVAKTRPKGRYMNQFRLETQSVVCKIAMKCPIAARPNMWDHLRVKKKEIEMSRASFCNVLWRKVLSYKTQYDVFLQVCIAIFKHCLRNAVSQTPVARGDEGQCYLLYLKNSVVWEETANRQAFQEFYCVQGM